MTRTKKVHFFLILFLQTIVVFGYEGQIKIPAYNDKYSAYVRQLESGTTEIDFADFRNSFLESAQYDKKGMNYDSLKKQVDVEIKNNNYQGVVSVAKGMLSIDYTSMFAHKYLQQAYKSLGDSANSNKYKNIEFGLLNSIIKSGDGKTCETGWHVTQNEEENFILYMLGADLTKQSLYCSEHNICDKTEVKTEKGKAKTYYFESNKVFEKFQLATRKWKR